MGILNNIFKKINSGFFYVVDKEKLKEFLNHEMHFGLENNLEDCTDLNVYINGEKHYICIWNYTASVSKSEQEKGVVVYFDKIEYNTIDELFNAQFNNVNGYFKIELIYTDSVELNDYKKENPELKVEDY